MLGARRSRWSVGAALGALVVVALVLTQCSGDKNAVDQNANGQFRYAGVTTKGKLIPQDRRRVAGDASAPFLTQSGTWQLSSLKGQVGVINFWGTWCPPCVIETPSFDKIYRATKSSGVAFVGIDVKESSKSKVHAFVSDNDISYPIVYDPPAQTAIQLGRVPATGLPITVLVDRQGRVAAVYGGAVAAGDLEPVLTTLIGEK